MNILVTLNANYLKPLKVMLFSLFLNNPGEQFHVYLMHSSLTDEEVESVSRFIEHEGQQLSAIRVSEEVFDRAPVVKHYSKEMYYRILAFRFLPPGLERILYLDPDLMIINEIRSLYDTNLAGNMFGAAYHDRLSVKEVNKLRLMPYEIEAYYNTGVLLMDLSLQREQIIERDIFSFVESNRFKLILPDQDIINALYGRSILAVDEVRYNYDPRYYKYYKLVSSGRIDMEYVVKHSSIIHFCGKRKPWNKNYTGNFHSLYKHYQKLAGV